ncbi:MAG: methylated-DNA--[protein]-cysteine S-methyltransferase [Candidatus Cloacimonadota bacterium]
MIYSHQFFHLEISTSQEAITRISFVTDPQPAPASTSLEKQIKQQLDEYFAGNRERFELPLCPQGTEFQKAVWQALSSIPYGQTRTYAQIAALIGKPKACRAVGMANHNNPLPILIPCHRVIGADGKLTGYAGGLTIKQLLLDLERRA